MGTTKHNEHHFFLTFKSFCISCFYGTLFITHCYRLINFFALQKTKKNTFLKSGWLPIWHWFALIFLSWVLVLAFMLGMFSLVIALVHFNLMFLLLLAISLNTLRHLASEVSYCVWCLVGIWALPGLLVVCCDRLCCWVWGGLSSSNFLLRSSHLIRWSRVLLFLSDMLLSTCSCLLSLAFSALMFSVSFLWFWV